MPMRPFRCERAQMTEVIYFFSLWSIYDFLLPINHRYESGFNNFGWTGQVYLFRQKTRLLDSCQWLRNDLHDQYIEKRKRRTKALMSMSTWTYICQHCENCWFTLWIFSLTGFFFKLSIEYKYLKFLERIL